MKKSAHRNHIKFTMEFLSLRILLFLLVTITSANFCFISMADFSPHHQTPPPTTSSPHNTTSTSKSPPPSPSRTHEAATRPPHNTSSTPRTHDEAATRPPHNTSSTPRTLPASTPSPHNTSSTPKIPKPTSRTPPSSSTTSPPSTTSTPIIPSPSPSTQVASSAAQEKQLLHIIEGLLATGNFASWANFLEFVNPAIFPVAATLFIPSDTALSILPNAATDTISLDPSVLAYHIVPQYLTFSDLKQLPLNSRIPTLLSTNFIVITNTSSNFTIDDSQVTHPDLYVSKEFCAHGVSKILDYKAYGEVSITFNEVDAADSVLPDKRKTPINGITGKPKKQYPMRRRPPHFKPRSSTAPSSSTSDFSMIFLVLGIALFLKID